MRREFIWILLLISFPIFSAEKIDPTDYSCHQTQVTTPPFFISDTYRQGGRAWDNLRGLVGDEKHKKKRYLPMGSVVYAPELMVEKYGESQSRIPVRVLYTPPLETDKILQGTDDARDTTGYYQRRRFRPLLRDTEGLERGAVGDLGYIHKRSLERANEYVYVLTEDSPLLRTKGPRPNTSPKYMTLATEGNKYIVNRCCLSDAAGPKDHCFDSYKFDLKNSDDNAVFKSTYISLDFCDVFEFARPIPEDDLTPILGVLEATNLEYPETDIFDLNILTGEGLRPYLTKVPVDPETSKGPHGSYHYKRDDYFSSDTWALPSTACVFNRIAEKWQEECKDPGCQIQFGDIYHQDAWGAHSSHDSGRCIDIRPFRKAEVIEGITPDQDKGLTYRNRRYDREKTRKFLALLIKAGSKNILFNDAKVENGLDKNWIVNPAGGHNDHIHVCFTPSNETVQKTCRDGL